MALAEDTERASGSVLSVLSVAHDSCSSLDRIINQPIWAGQGYMRLQEGIDRLLTADCLLCTSMRKEHTMTHTAIPAETRIGHVHLKVADLERAVGFYRDLLGFDLLFDFGTAAFLSAGGYHHHIGLNTWESQGGAPPAPGTTGLYHF